MVPYRYSYPVPLSGDPSIGVLDVLSLPLPVVGVVTVLLLTVDAVSDSSPALLAKEEALSEDAPCQDRVIVAVWSTHLNV